MNPELPLLIDAKKLEHAGEDVRVLDARSPLRYEAGHLPNAVNLFIVALMQARANGAQVLGPPAHIERILSAAGISATQPVVVYGEQGSQDAAYLFWALEYAGHQSISLLDGGLEAWLRAGKKLTLAVPVVAESNFAVHPAHHKRATGECLLNYLHNPEIFLLDNRSPEEFSGQEVLARRGGHIPGARHFEWTRSLKPDLSFRHPEEIAADLEALGVCRGQTLVNYCQNGIRSAHAYFAQRLAGFPNVCNYDGSWAEWGNSERYPVER